MSLAFRADTDLLCGTFILPHPHPSFEYRQHWLGLGVTVSFGKL